MVVGAIVFAYQLEKLDDVLQRLLGDALARSVYTDLDTMGTVQHGRGEHADTNRLSKRRGVLIKTSCCICLKLSQNFALFIPQNFACKLASRLSLPENAWACSYEIVSVVSVVVTPVPNILIQETERVATELTVSSVSNPSDPY
jgi:hypothetical protein